MPHSLIPVLFIAFEFPPVNITGAQRSAKFAKYLREYGIDPVVVTLDAADASAAFSASVEGALRADLPQDLTIYALPTAGVRPAPSSSLRRFLSIFGRAEDPFARQFWPGLRKALPAIAARHRPQAVVVSLPPFSAGRLAATVADSLGLPLIVDMRDGWSHWCAGAFPSYAHWLTVYHRERKLFAAARHVVTVTDQLADVFRRSHPQLPHERFHVIPNGFDGALELPPRLDVPERSDTDPVTIGYVGSYYYSPAGREAALSPWWRRRGHRKLHYQPVREDWLYRSPHFFLRALAELRRRAPQLGRRIRYVHIGRVPEWWDAMIGEHDLGDAVSCMGMVPHAEVRATAQTCDALLCTSVKVEGGEDYALASKTFDYLLTGRPILGIVTRGAQREFLERSGMAVVADADDLDASVEALALVARGGFTLHPSIDFLSTYHRRSTTAQLAALLHDATRDPHTISGRRLRDITAHETLRNSRMSSSASG